MSMVGASYVVADPRLLSQELAREVMLATHAHSFKGSITTLLETKRLTMKDFHAC